MMKKVIWLYGPICICFLYSILLYLMSLTFLKQAKLETQINFSSSVWCNTGFKNQKSCIFRNICYSYKHKTFIFFLNINSVLFGLEPDDIKKVQLSSVENHNKFYMNISLVNSNNFTLDNSILVEGKVLLFARFKPDNIMHVFHDDIMPLYFTLEEICLGDMQKCLREVTLIFYDENEKGPFFQYYKLFSNKELLFLTKLNQYSTLCFTELYAGLNIASVWFQYGFNKPQGELQSQIKYQDIHRFSSFVVNQLGLSCNSEDQNTVVFLSRTLNRRILNEKMVENMITESYNEVYQKSVTVKKLDISTNNTLDIITNICSSKFLVGMHGSAMIFSIFMADDSAIVELFPFAIQAEHVSFIKAFSKITGAKLSYVAWHNIHEDHSLTHPNYPNLLGGLNHLSDKERLYIENVKMVGPVVCCNNPAYLYRMYQDTWVSPTLKNQLMSALQQQSNMVTDRFEFLINYWLYPAAVTNITAIKNSKNIKTICWTKPFNIHDYDIEYNLYFVKGEISNNNVKTFSVRGTCLNITSSDLIECNTSYNYHLWISCKLIKNNLKSVDTYLVLRDMTCKNNP